MDTLELALDHPLRSFRLSVAATLGRETLALVGPSGAGKSSVLRAIAGLLRPERGRVALGGAAWLDTEAGVDLPPERRSVGLVFQEYALFPHLDVRRNVAFGGRERVDELLERFRISHLAGRAPRSTSPAASASASRSPARSPATPPCCCSTSRSRRSTPTRARSCEASSAELLAELGLPTLLVTHDFEDAAALADRVGVIVGGRILQLGTAAELLAAPADAFVASFTGANLLHGIALPGPDGLTEVVLDDGSVAYSTDAGTGRVGLAVYPWEVALARVEPTDSAVNHLRGEVRSLVALGNRVRIRVGPLTAEVTSASAERLGLREGDAVVASFKATASRLVPLS